MVEDGTDIDQSVLNHLICTFVPCQAWQCQLSHSAMVH